MFEKDFENMLRTYGDSIDDKKRFLGTIADLFPNDKKNLNLMIFAYNIGIAQEIQKVPKITNAFAYRFVKQLVDDYGLSRANADWVISVWCVCYGKNILGKDCEIKLQNRKSPAIQAVNTSGNAGKKYGDLFRYRPASMGKGLCVYGFSGSIGHTMIFQNESMGKPVVEIADGIFEGQDLEEVIITDGYKTIGQRAFKDNQKLRQVVMPYSLEEIGDGAFENCKDLRRVNIPGRVERIGEKAFKNTGLRTVQFPESVYYVGAEVFADCAELDNLVIPKNIDKLSDGMFSGCTNLKKVELTEGLVTIGDRAFMGCKELDLLTIPDSVTAIGNHAFDLTNKMFIIQCSVGTFAESFARDHRIKYQLI